MDLPLNRNPPRVMHIDLNSCFASVEQQANPLLRGRPVAVAAYHTPSGVIVSPSVEAKCAGVRTGMTVRDGRLLCPELVVLRPDPAKYRDVHARLKRLLRDYSPRVSPKSIDEAVVDFGPAGRMDRDLRDIGREIKRRLRGEVGGWMRASVGIGPNRFLAKTAAGLHKPDGLDVIDHRNLREVLAGLELTDLCGINRRYQARLYAAGIYTTEEFMDASGGLLRDRVFGGINGHYWYLRLRGWEIDAVDHGRRSFGQMYSLPRATADPRELSPLLMKLCEKAGRRMRRAGHSARGIHVGVVHRDYTHWHRGVTLPAHLYTTRDLFRNALLVLGDRPQKKPVSKLAVSAFALQRHAAAQLELWDDARAGEIRLSRALDEINDRWGEFVITPALMLGLQGQVLDRISFGSIRDLEDLYAEDD